MGISCSKPSAPEDILEDPEPGSTPTFHMIKGCCQPGWTVKDEDDALWLFVKTSGNESDLQNFKGDALGHAEIDAEHYETTCKESTEFEDSDSDDDDDDGFYDDMDDDDDSMLKHKLKWKTKRTVDFHSEDGSTEGSISFKLKGKAKVKVRILDPPPESGDAFEIVEEESKTKKAIYKLSCNGVQTKHKIKGADEGPDIGDISFPDAFNIDWGVGDGACTSGMTVTVTGDYIPTPMVPLVAQIVVDHMHPGKIAGQMQAEVRSSAEEVARERSNMVDG